MRYLGAMIVTVLLLFGLEQPSAALAAPALAVSPSSGPPGTIFTISGSGFASASTVQVIVFYLGRSASGGQGEIHVLEQRVTTGADGSFTLKADSTNYVPETYHITTIEGGSQVGASFKVTPIPGVPNTGAGGMQRHDLTGGISGALIGCGMLLGLCAWSGWRRRRGRSAR